MLTLVCTNYATTDPTDHWTASGGQVELWRGVPWGVGVLGWLHEHRTRAGE
jgi:hypothetical protein